MSYLDSYLPVCESFEGQVAHFYLDTVGRVTIGVGNMVPGVAAAQQLPLVTGSGAPATADQIAQDFARVSALPKARMPSFYAAPGCPILTSDAIAALLKTRLQAFDAELRQLFPAFDAWPLPAQLAAMDMIFNLGPRKVLTGYPRLLAAGRVRDFRGMAANCSRDASVASFAIRNAWTQRQFLAAAGILG